MTRFVLMLAAALGACGGNEQPEIATRQISFGDPYLDMTLMLEEQRPDFGLGKGRDSPHSWLLPPDGDSSRVHLVQGEAYLGAILTPWDGVECTATLIGRDMIVTAAHCFSCRNGSSWDPFLGLWFMV